LVCHCSSKASLVTAWTDDNPGRRFYGCWRYFQRIKCNFFRCYDPEVPERQKNIIRALLKKNVELKYKERSLPIAKVAIIVLGVMLLISVFVMCFKLVW